MNETQQRAKEKRESRGIRNIENDRRRMAGTRFGRIVREVIVNASGAGEAAARGMAAIADVLKADSAVTTKEIKRGTWRVVIMI